MKTLVVYFSRADENYNVGAVEVGNTEILLRERRKELGSWTNGWRGWGFRFSGIMVIS